MAVEPDQAQIQELVGLAGRDDDGPVLMLNLNSYRERAAYEGAAPGGEATDVSGHEAYERYATVAQPVLERVGGKVLWYAETKRTVIGDESDSFDEVIAAWYPSIAAFMALVTDPAILEARAHRVAGLEKASLTWCASGPEPVLQGA